MRIFVPFTSLKSETYAALPQGMLIPIVDKEHGYARYFRDRWREGETFINVEHDVVPTENMLKELWYCEKSLCVTNLGGKGVSLLGCVKISREFIQAHPGIFDHYPEYNSCDGCIAKCVTGNLYHEHGVVEHLH